MKSERWKHLSLLGIALLVLNLASACGTSTPETEREAAQGSAHGIAEPEPVPLGAGEMLQVVATTNIVGDVVSRVGGEQIELTTLMGVGIDPHTYVPTPSHTAALHDAHVVFANGAGLEANLEEMFDSAGGDAIRVQLSQGLEHLEVAAESEDAEHEDEHGDIDPHVWFDVQNVIHWTESIEHTLSALDHGNAQVYRANAQAYVEELEALDAWVVDQIATVPEANRRLVTNHPVFGYFADRYGLEQLGAVYPLNPSAEPSAQDIAALEDAIREYGVPAVFAESTVNPKLAEQVARDTGIRLVPLYTGSLGEPGSGAETYILLIRYDVGAIVDALQ